MIKYLPFLFKNESKKKIRTDVKIGIHVFIIFLFSLIYYNIILNTTIDNNNNKNSYFYYKYKGNNKTKTNKKSVIFFNALYFSLIVHTTTGFSTLIPTYEIKNNIVIIIHLFIAFLLIITL